MVGNAKGRQIYSRPEYSAATNHRRGWYVCLLDISFTLTFWWKIATKWHVLGDRMISIVDSYYTTKPQQCLHLLQYLRNPQIVDTHLPYRLTHKIAHYIAAKFDSLLALLLAFITNRQQEKSLKCDPLLVNIAALAPSTMGTLLCIKVWRRPRNWQRRTGNSESKVKHTDLHVPFATHHFWFIFSQLKSCSKNLMNTRSVCVSACHDQSVQVYCFVYMVGSPDEKITSSTRIWSYRHPLARELQSCIKVLVLCW